MVHWNLSPHPISDVRDWSDAGRLELRPDFQRREVWALPAKIMLIDSILSDIPLPKIFLAKNLVGGSTYRIVIDGQQRIAAILAFLRDEFPLEPPYSGPHSGLRFSELDTTAQEHILRYRLDFNEADNPDDRETRDVYMRVNKYTVPLTKQELRRADYPGDFLDVAEELAVVEFFETGRVFSTADRRRYADAEYVSELLAALIAGVQDKKSDLDSFYISLGSWEPTHRAEVVQRFKAVLRDIDLVFSMVPGQFKETRFRQKADLYSLVVAIDGLHRADGTLEHHDLSALIEDIRLLDDAIEPESEIPILSEYAIKCVSQANSAASRRWRATLLSAIFAGTYLGRPPRDAESVDIFYAIAEGRDQGSAMCPDPEVPCPMCDVDTMYDHQNCVLAWPPGTREFQLSNSEWVHIGCLDPDSGWRHIRRTRDQDREPNLL